MLIRRSGCFFFNKEANFAVGKYCHGRVGTGAVDNLMFVRPSLAVVFADPNGDVLTRSGGAGHGLKEQFVTVVVVAEDVAVASGVGEVGDFNRVAPSFAIVFREREDARAFEAVANAHNEAAISELNYF